MRGIVMRWVVGLALVGTTLAGCGRQRVTDSELEPAAAARSPYEGVFGAKWEASPPRRLDAGEVHNAVMRRFAQAEAFDDRPASRATFVDHILGAVNAEMAARGLDLRMTAEEVDAIIEPWIAWHEAGVFHLTGTDTLADRRLLETLRRNGWLSDVEFDFLDGYLARERARRRAGGDPARALAPQAVPPTRGTAVFVEIFRASSRLEWDRRIAGDEGEGGGHRPPGWFGGYLGSVADAAAGKLLEKVSTILDMFGSPVVSGIVRFAVDNAEKFGDRPCPDCVNPCFPKPCW